MVFMHRLFGDIRYSMWSLYIFTSPTIVLFEQLTKTGESINYRSSELTYFSLNYIVSSELLIAVTTIRGSADISLQNTSTGAGLDIISNADESTTRQIQTDSTNGLSCGECGLYMKFRFLLTKKINLLTKKINL